MFGSMLRVLMPVLSLMLLTFGAGVFITEMKIPPYHAIHDGAKTLLWSWRIWNKPPFHGTFVTPVRDIAPDEASAARLKMTLEGAALPETLLMTGGLNQYLEICPEQGCLAVEMDRNGKILRGIPFRPEEIFAADITEGSFYRERTPSDPREVFRPVGLQVMEDGDILVSFLATGPMFPYAAGVARVDPEGHPRWYRFDYSHHWLTYDNGRIYVPDLTVGQGDLNVSVGPDGKILSEYCNTTRPMVDGIAILDTDGQVIKRIDMMKLLRESPWSALLATSFDACDPLHLNYVDVLDETAPGGDLAPGNLLVSLRNLSAIAVVDPEQERITRIVRGTFQHQHSPHHLEGSKILLFDNFGAAGADRGSRLLEIDLNNGPERQIFPSADATDQMFSFREGHINISPDRQRALVSFTDAGGVEVDLATGDRLASFDSLHDLSEVEAAPKAAATSAMRAKLFGMYYLQP